MHETNDDRKAQLLRWLKENVLTPPRPSRICITEVQMDWLQMRGSFSLTLDDVRLEDRFTLCYEMNGRIGFAPPVFHSPLCLPISFNAVELDQKTEEAIQRALDRVFPVIRGFGRHKKGKIVDLNSSLKSRVIDRASFETQRALIDAGDIYLHELVATD